MVKNNLFKKLKFFDQGHAMATVRSKYGQAMDSVKSRSRNKNARTTVLKNINSFLGD